LALLLAETLRHGAKAGMKVALAPVITDLPIIALTLFLVANLSGFHRDRKWRENKWNKSR